MTGDWHVDADTRLEQLAEKLADMRQELEAEVNKWSAQPGSGALEQRAREKLGIVEELQDVLYGDD